MGAGPRIPGLLPDGWRERLVSVRNENTDGVTVHCPDAHDLCVAKLLAGRDKDSRFVRALLVSGHVRPATLLERSAGTTAETWQRRNGSSPGSPR